MHYVLLIYGDESRALEMTPEQIQEARAAVMPDWLALFADLEQSGKLVDGNELSMSTDAKTVRVRGGEPLVTDGPYAETKEALGGYFLLDCDNLDEAIEWAAKVPSASRGVIEVRPVVEH
jgi:hypothetical protein